MGHQLSLLNRIQTQKFQTNWFGCITTIEGLNEMERNIPQGGRVALDVEGSPDPFCLFMAFFDSSLILHYGSIALQPRRSLSVLDLQFQANSGWTFHPARENEKGICYQLIDAHGVKHNLPIDQAQSPERKECMIPSIARLATASQARSLLRGESISFIKGTQSFPVTKGPGDPWLAAAKVSDSDVICTGNIFHLTEDAPLPQYQNTLLEQIMIGRLVPNPLQLEDVTDNCYYAMELVDGTGLDEYFPVCVGSAFLKQISNKSLLRILPVTIGGSTIDMPPTTLDIMAIQAFLQMLVAKHGVMFMAHVNAKEERDLAVSINFDAEDVVKRMSSLMTVLDRKRSGSDPLFYLLHAILSSKSSGPIPICDGVADLSMCFDIHSLPVEVCVVAMVHEFLTTLSNYDIVQAIKTSIVMPDDNAQRAEIVQALQSLCIR